MASNSLVDTTMLDRNRDPDYIDPRTNDAGHTHNNTLSSISNAGSKQKVILMFAMC
jgi:hypothetical protein